MYLKGRFTMAQKVNKDLEVLASLYKSLIAILALSYKYLKNANTSLNDLFQSLIIGTCTFQTPDKKEITIGTKSHKWTAPRNAVAPEKGLGFVESAYPDSHGGGLYVKLGVGHGMFTSLNEVLTGVGYILISLLAGDVVSQSETFRASVLKVMLSELEKIGYIPIKVELYKSDSKADKIINDRSYDLESIKSNLAFHYSHADYISGLWDTTPILQAAFPAPDKKEKVKGEPKLRQW
jgi:hypothetical protein